MNERRTLVFGASRLHCMACAGRQSLCAACADRQFSERRMIAIRGSPLRRKAHLIGQQFDQQMAAAPASRGRLRGLPVHELLPTVGEPNCAGID